MFTHPNPKRVLVIGGGDGGAAREALKHDQLEKVVVVEIDKEVVAECKANMPSIANGAFDDSRLELIIEDGLEYVKNVADNTFDVIIVDIPNAGTVNFSTSFYQNCNRILTTNGVISTHSLMPMRQDSEKFKTALAPKQEAFGKDKTYIYLIPTDTYNGQTALTLSFKEDVHPEDIDKDRVKRFRD